MAFIAAVHLITSSKDVGSAILGAAMMVFDGKDEHHYAWLAQGWENWDSDDVLARFKKEALAALQHTAEVIPADLFASRILGRQAFHDTEATIWQNDYESHLSHRAYLYAVTADKSKLYEKGFNFDGEALNAANRFVGDSVKWSPTTTDNPLRGPEFLAEAFFHARKYLGHSMESQASRTLRKGAPTLSAAAAPKPPVIHNQPPAIPTAGVITPPPVIVQSVVAPPVIPVMNQLTPPVLPPTMPALPPKL